MKPFWTTPKKVAFTILLAILAWYIFGCGGPVVPAPCISSPKLEHWVQSPKAQGPQGDTDLPYLRAIFRTYNDAYFDNKLKEPKIAFYEFTRKEEINDTANTFCHSDGECDLSFNTRYLLAPRFADSTMLHEMCHMKEWGKDIDAEGKPYDHGRIWRGCMLTLDAEGAFRIVTIDRYWEK